MNDFWKNYYGQLVGYTITEFRGLEEDEFPAFTLKSPDGKHLIISLSCDPEGNGGGFLFIDDAVKVGG